MEYHKIKTVFNRDMEGSKKLIEGQYSDPSIKYLKDNKWEFTEKIDGTNIRVCWDGHNVSFLGRTDRAQIPAHLLEKLAEMFGGETNEQIFEQKFGENPVVIYGEGYGPKIQKGGLYRDDVSFILFDVLIGGLFLARENCEDIAAAFGVDIVPVILEGTIEQAVEFVKQNPKSTMGTANMEGLVGRPKIEMRDRRGNRLVVKIKACDFASA